MDQIICKTWVLLRPSYKKGKLIRLGIMGSGFFINHNKLVTAYHCLNDDAFIPNEEYNNTDIIISAQGEKLLTIDKKNVEYHPDIDVTFIHVPDSKNFFLCSNVIDYETKVTNIGFPCNEISSLINPKSLDILEVRKRTGKILNINNLYTINSNDVNINNKEVIILDYSVTVGFSGGPLLQNGIVIGMMSHINPITHTAVAISSKYLLD